jgi:hypothetical protein
MLGLAGIRLHPALRIAIGAALVAGGLALPAARPLAIVGAALLLFGIASALGLVHDDDEAGDRAG